LVRFPDCRLTPKPGQSFEDMGTLSGEDKSTVPRDGRKDAEPNRFNEVPVSSKQREKKQKGLQSRHKKEGPLRGRKKKKEGIPGRHCKFTGGEGPKRNDRQTSDQAMFKGVGKVYLSQHKEKGICLLLGKTESTSSLTHRMALRQNGKDPEGLQGTKGNFTNQQKSARKGTAAAKQKKRD